MKYRLEVTEPDGRFHCQHFDTLEAAESAGERQQYLTEHYLNTIIRDRIYTIWETNCTA